MLASGGPPKALPTSCFASVKFAIQRNMCYNKKGNKGHRKDGDKA